MEGPVYEHSYNNKLSEKAGILPRTAQYLQNEIIRYQKELKMFVKNF